jgi:DNA replication protein DnaD
MENKNFRLSGGPSLAVPVSDADKLLSAGDGASALLYLYALRSGGSFSPGKAAAALGRTEREISDAAAVLCGLGLFSPGETGRELPLPADELPEYTAEDIARRTEDSGEFRAVVEETQRRLGRMLTGADLKLLFGIYDYLRLPAEVIFLLINHCVEETRERLGPGKAPSMRSIEKEAYAWYNRELLTLERAEEYLLRKRTRAGAMNDVRRLLQISGRSFSATERKYVESWLDLDFGLESIALAYDKTVVKTGSLTWKYMDSILASWHTKGLRTPEEIALGDGRTGQALSPPLGAAAAVPRQSPESGSERMRKTWDRVKNG